MSSYTSGGVYERRMESFLFVLISVLFYSQIACAGISTKHDNLLSKLSNHRLIRPYRSTADGEFLTFDLSTKSEAAVHRRRRSSDGIDEADMSSSYHFVVESIDGENMILNMDRVQNLFSPNFVIEKFTEDNRVITETPNTNCFFQGHVGNVPNTEVAISTCAGLSGVISIGEDDYVIEPVDVDQPSSITNASLAGTHVIYRTTDHEGHQDAIDLLRPIDLTHDVASSDENNEEMLRARRAPPKLETDRTHYVQTMLVADQSLQDFHGASVKIYLATLMNIVNKIYKHESLGLNIQFVIVKMELLNSEQSQSIIRETSSEITTSLRNANEWAVSHNRPADHSEHFDMSIFVTRTNFGASGYANVGDICRPSLSATLVQDNEGLKTAFVVAHEAAHLFGVQHDNGEKSCKQDADSSAIMAAYVTSNFHNYYWSPCTRNQIYKKMRNGDLQCLLDRPVDEDLETTYPGLSSSFDEQCQFIYGPQATACTRVDRDLCGLLYCQTDPDTPECTAGRRSRALEGTPCGKRRWCIQGECQVRRNVEVSDAIHEWHAGEWGPCSISCGGVGIKTRELTCREVVYDKSGRLEEIRSPVQKSLCHPDLKPSKTTECPVKDCSADWSVGEWSDCSKTCGAGTRTRTVTCDIPEDTELSYRCFGFKPEKTKVCESAPCEETGECVPRPGKICKAKNYERYCRIPGYEEECCYTCAQQRDRVASWRGKRTND